MKIMADLIDNDKKVQLTFVKDYWSMAKYKKAANSAIPHYRVNDGYHKKI